MAFLNMFQPADVCKPLPAMDAEQVARYGHFRELLVHNRAAMNLLADLEQLYYSNRPFTLQHVDRKIDMLLRETKALIGSLARMSNKDYRLLTAALNTIGRSLQLELAGDESSAAHPLILPLGRIDRNMTKVVGAKAANLAHLRGRLAMPTPDGFAVTVSAYWHFMKETGLLAEIDEHMAGLVADDPASLEATGKLIHERIMTTPLPAAIVQAMREEAATLSAAEGLFAVRSSAVGEDGEVSFAGQYVTVLNVAPQEFAEAYKKVVASKYSAAALSYRLHHGMDDLDTPMAVLVIPMIQPSLSGVLFTVDPQTGDQNTIRVSGVAGLGENLVGGEISAQRRYRVGKTSGQILAETEYGDVSSDVAESRIIGKLRQYALDLERDFQRPLDVEWAVDGEGDLFLLQVRPMFVAVAEEETIAVADSPDHPLRIEDGKCASPGIAEGRVLVWPGGDTAKLAELLEPDTILVTRTATTMLTPWVDRVKGIVTDIGSASSHLASVAREFGVPALFDTRIATSVLATGEAVTLWSSNKKIYQGSVPELTTAIRPPKRPIFASPAHLRMQRLLDHISPLNLTDPASPEFQQEGCRTIHDIIRYCHELSVREMFRFSEATDRDRNAVQLKVALPFQLFALNLGGGWRTGLTTCDEINAHEVDCLPFRALWAGLSHPGIDWTSSVAVDAHNFMSLLAGGAMPHEGRLGGASYAVISNDYMNLSIRFGYHFATVDALCTKEPDLNYAALHFAGGAGAYVGKTLRLQFMANVLGRLGFATTQKGELIEASLARLDRPSMLETLEQLGRLLGCTRLLDMAIVNPRQLESMTEAFFQRRFNFLDPERGKQIEGFHVILGDWRKDRQDGDAVIVQDGSHFSSPLTMSITRKLGRFIGQRRYMELLDNMEAYYYFPMIIARRSNISGGSVEVSVKAVSGIIDQAGGLAFAIRDWANYFVFRVNALENNAMLFEFHNNKRVQRAGADLPVRAGTWYRLRIVTDDGVFRAFVDERQVLEYVTEKDPAGYIGLWTKADSVSHFKNLLITPRRSSPRKAA